VKKSALASIASLAGLGLAIASFASAQHSPAPDRPAESGLKTNRGGTVPPAPSDGTRFNPNPPPPLPGTQETPPGGKVKTEEKIGTPVPGTPSPVATPAPTTNPKVTATPAGATTPAPKPARIKRPARPKATPSPKAS
jgi:hypothetical protein